MSIIKKKEAEIEEATSPVSVIQKTKADIETNIETSTETDTETNDAADASKKKHKLKKLEVRKHLILLTPMFILLLGILCYFAARWYSVVYCNTGFDSILFTITNNLGGVQPELIFAFLGNVILPTLLILTGIGFLLFFAAKKARSAGKHRAFFWFSTTVAAALTVALVSCAAEKVGLKEYIAGKMQKTQIYEDHYVDPKTVEINFPEQKRNLIFILLESMETAYFAEADGGASTVNLVPELYTLAQENLNFSHNDGVGGFRPVGGTTWTIGSMVGQTSGVPLVTPNNIIDRQNGYGEDGEFLPGLTTMQDILHENGYYQALMVGSEASFGGRKAYYECHNTDVVYELSTAQADGIVPEDYHVWWGMEDKHLYQYAMQELPKIAQMDQPFAFTMLTVDTHHISGYLCDYCQDEHGERYENVISCASKQLNDFVTWIQAQDFYENTTIVICGDHPSMDAGYFMRNVSDDYIRRCYNCIINPLADAVNTQNRDFSTLDMFPTILAAMGCTFEGDRLGLGTNLFSSQPTLMEELGVDEFLAQIGMSSDYYGREFRLDTEEIE